MMTTTMMMAQVMQVMQVMMLVMIAMDDPSAHDA